MAGRVARLSAAALVALAGAACGGHAGKGTTTVRFWAFGREGEVVHELVPAFEAANPDVHVEVQQIPWTAAHEKLLTAFVGHATPDAAQLGNTWIPEMVALGALAPLDARLEGSSIDRDDEFAGVWQTNVLGGKVWGVPWYVDTRLLFYRTDLVAGGPWPPHSWEEWRRAMEGIRARGGPDRYAILLPIDEFTQPVVLALQAGSHILGPDNRRGAFTTPAFRRAMAFYTGLFADHLAPPLDQTGLGNLYQQFEQGAFAMVITGPWNLGEFRRRLPAAMQDRWSTAPLPPPDAGMQYPGASVAGGSSLVLFARSRVRDAAWRWVEYLAAPAQQARFYQLTGDLPARRSAWQHTDLARDPQAEPFQLQLEHVVSTPKVPEWERIATRIAECAEQVVRGGRPLDVALADLQADVDRMLEKRRWMLDRAAVESGR